MRGPRVGRRYAMTEARALALTRLGEARSRAYVARALAGGSEVMRGLDAPGGGRKDGGRNGRG